MTIQLLTAVEVAEQLRLSPFTVYRWAASGRIPRVLLPGGLVRFDPAAVAAVCGHSVAPVPSPVRRARSKRQPSTRKTPAGLPAGMRWRDGAFELRHYTGGRRVTTRLGTDRDAAIRRCAEIRAAPVPGTSTPGAPVLVETAARQWLEIVIRAERTPRDAKTVASRAERFLIPAFRGRLVSEVRPVDLQTFRAGLGELGETTRMHVCAMTRQFFRWATHVARYAPSCPVPPKFVRTPAETRVETLSEAEVEALVELPGPDGFLCRLLLATGLRWGELRALHVEDLERGQILIRQSKGRRLRWVPISKELETEIRRRGDPVCPVVNAQTFAGRVRKAAAVPRFHAHLTRHTFAVQWLAAGESVEILRALLGHSTVKTTERYARSTEAIRIAAAGRVRDALRADTPDPP